MGAPSRPIPIPYPLSTFPGANPQESSGRLLNAYSEPLGEATRPTGPAQQVWRRSPGLSRYAKTAQTNFRGGLLVNNLAYEVFNGAVLTVDATGTLGTLTGSVNGTKKVSIARNIPGAIIIVDPDNGAFQITGSTIAGLNSGGVLPVVNSVCFQDGYFFFTIGDGRTFASPIGFTSNGVTPFNALTFVQVQAKSDVTLLRGIAFSGVLWLFTTGHCEIWQNTAVPFPAFPYSRLLVLETGLVQANAIAGWEVGFSELLWVAQDFAVYWSSPGGYAGGTPLKVSPPDLEKLIEAQVKAGNTLEAWCYMFSGKKFWVLSSPAWTWEFNLTTKRWNERSSFFGGLQTQFRATGGHPAFGKWLTGDRQSGDILVVDTQNYTERGVPLLMRMESGPVRDFPNNIRIARGDFDFTMGTGIAVGSFTQKVTNAVAADGAGSAVRLTMLDTSQMHTNDTVNISGITGTIEANGTRQIIVVDDQHIDLVGTVFAQTYISGGTVVDVTSPPNAQQPTCAISVSKDGGITWGNPLVRQIGAQQKTQRQRASVKSMGLSGPMGDRWRVDITDPVYAAFLGGTQSSDPHEVGT